MPKMKTHSGTKKRVKVSAGGKLMRQQVNMRHNLESKPTSRTRRLGLDAAVSPADAKKIKRQLGL